jgi:formate-nitrite transporter family protein
MYDYLFHHQQPLDDNDLKKYAENIGLDTDKFNREFSDRIHILKIKEDLISGENSGVRGTPTIFINGLRYDDSYDLDSIINALNKVKDNSSIS